jgi:hypothetical protein
LSLCPVRLEVSGYLAGPGSPEVELMGRKGEWEIAAMVWTCWKQYVRRWGLWKVFVS